MNSLWPVFCLLCGEGNRWMIDGLIMFESSSVRGKSAMSLTKIRDLELTQLGYLVEKGGGVRYR